MPNTFLPRSSLSRISWPSLPGPSWPSPSSSWKNDQYQNIPNVAEQTFRPHRLLASKILSTWNGFQFKWWRSNSPITCSCLVLLVIITIIVIIITTIIIIVLNKTISSQYDWCIFQIWILCNFARSRIFKFRDTLHCLQGLPFIIIKSLSVGSLFVDLLFLLDLSSHKVLITNLLEVNAQLGDKYF